MQNNVMKKLKKHISEIKLKFKLKEIGVFGSRIKGKARKGSDIDILVEFEEGAETFDNYMDLKFFLEDLFHTKVDLVVKHALREELKEDILSEVIYV